jgi:LytR cell envelope-related transcriptional attenuator
VARPSGGSTVHIGKAAALIVAAVLLGALVLRDQGVPSSVSAGDFDDDTTQFTQPTIDPGAGVTTTTVGNTTHAKNTVKVQAINATGQKGKGGQAGNKLVAAGYNSLQAGTASAAVTSSRPASVVYVVTAGYEADAREIAALFGLPDSAVRAYDPTKPPSTEVKPDANIIVLVGSGITL